MVRSSSPPDLGRPPKRRSPARSTSLSPDKLPEDLRRSLLRFPDFCASWLRIKSRSRQLIPLLLNGAQTILYGRIQEQEQAGLPVRIAVLKARQLGISTLCQAYMFWKVVTQPNTHGLCVAHNTKTTERIFDMSRTFYDYLPVKPMRRYATVHTLVFENPKDEQRAARPGLRSVLEVRTAGTPAAARGITYHILHLSEVAEWPSPDVLVSALFPAVPYEAGTCIILESTAHGAGDWWHAFWKECKEGSNGFTPVFIPWYTIPEYSLHGKLADAWMDDELDPEEKELVKRFGLSREQLAWRRMKLRELGDEDLFRQEFPLTEEDAWTATGLPVFPRDKLRLALSKCREPEMVGWLDEDLNFHPDRRGPLHVWEKPQPGARYTIGVDVSGGIDGGDYSCAEVIKSGTNEQVAEWHGLVDPVELATEVERLARWYNEAMVAPEINNHGIATLNELRRHYWNIYRWRHLDSFADRMTMKLGWETNVRTKPLIIEHMKHLINIGNVKVPGQDLLVEMMYFIQDRPGSGRAAPGYHDDRVMAFMIACFCDHVENPTAYGQVIESGPALPEGKLLDPRQYDTKELSGEAETTDWRVL